MSRDGPAASLPELALIMAAHGKSHVRHWWGTVPATCVFCSVLIRSCRSCCFQEALEQQEQQLDMKRDGLTARLP